MLPDTCDGGKLVTITKAAHEALLRDREVLALIAAHMPEVVDAAEDDYAESHNDLAEEWGLDVDPIISPRGAF